MFHLPFAGWDAAQGVSLPLLPGSELFLGIGDALHANGVAIERQKPAMLEAAVVFVPTSVLPPAVSTAVRSEPTPPHTYL